MVNVLDLRIQKKQTRAVGNTPEISYSSDLSSRFRLDDQGETLMDPAVFADIKKKPKSKILSFAINTIVYIALVAGLVWGLPHGLSKWLNTTYPMAAITSGSMWPALKKGDLVFIQGVDKAQLAVGDIVVFQPNEGGTFVIHRIIKLGGSTFQTKGDGNFDPDTPVPYENLVGRLVRFGEWNAHLPYFGSVTVIANNLKK